MRTPPNCALKGSGVWFTLTLLAVVFTVLQLVVREQNEATGPRIGFLRLKGFGDSGRQGDATGHPQSNQHQTRVTSGRKFAAVREIQILGDEKPLRSLGGLPDFRVGLAAQLFLPYVVNVVAEGGKA